MSARCDDWEILPGSNDWRYFEVTNDNDPPIVIDAQPVAVSVDHQVTWHAAEWTGAAAVTRDGRVMLAASDFPQNRNPVPVFIRVLHGASTVIFRAGNAYVR